ncbi:hypothetical protein BRD00_04140 [Halobacteriales archaeon QS_8_69_26]|nr:MAG: hypothetical protein BRD00_04140 [Halobacteriales archaeon QS_8_69_26]
MYDPTRIAAFGALLAGVMSYGVVLRFLEGDPLGPTLWFALVLAVVTFVVLRRNLAFELEEELEKGEE